MQANFFCLVFIYSMPGYNCSIKERMLYSSCKAPLLDVIENHLSVPVAKKVANQAASIIVNLTMLDFSSRSTAAMN